MHFTAQRVISLLDQDRIDAQPVAHPESFGGEGEKSK